MTRYGNIFDRGMLSTILSICKCCFIRASFTCTVCTLFVEMEGKVNFKTSDGTRVLIMRTDWYQKKI